MSRKTFRPILQGGSRFCGPYAVMNATRLCIDEHGLQYRDFVDLFGELARFLLKQGHLGYILRNGTRDDQLWMLIDFAITHLRRRYRIKIVAHRPFRHNRKPDLRKFVTFLKDYLKVPGRAVLVRFQIYDEDAHYSVARSITQNSILLYDSAGMKRLSFDACATGDLWPSRSRRYVLRTESTIYFEVLN